MRPAIRSAYEARGDLSVGVGAAVASRFGVVLVNRLDLTTTTVVWWLGSRLLAAGEVLHPYGQDFWRLGVGPPAPD